MRYSDNVLVCRKGSPMTAAEVREAVTEYIKDNRLQCQSNKE